MSNLNANIVVVDDDPEIRNVIGEYLSSEGYAVREAPDGETMKDLIREDVPDAVLLDLRLPGDDGLSLARSLRDRYPAMGILMISGKEEVVDRVAGLEVGADDYLVKPFHMRELLARVRSVLRRQENHLRAERSPADADPGADEAADLRALYRFEDWVLDEDRRTLVRFADGTPTNLTSGEFDLLLAFVSRPNRALTRDQLLDYAYNRRADSFDRSIDVQVGRLRRKIEKDPKRPTLIKTIRNVGYMFTAEVSRNGV